MAVTENKGAEKQKNLHYSSFLCRLIGSFSTLWGQ